MIVQGEHVARFVSERLDFVLCPPYTTLGISQDGELIAGVLFNQWEGPNIHVTVAGKGWSRAFLEVVGQYVFDQLGCTRLTFITEQPKVAELAKRLGCKVEGVMRDNFGVGRDGVLLGCLRFEWKFDRLMQRG